MDQVFNVIVMLVWLNASNGNLAGAEFVGTAPNTQVCEQLAATAIGSKPERLAELEAKGFVPVPACLDVSEFAKSLPQVDRANKQKARGI